MKLSPRIEIADLFCGAGGTSTGAIEAAQELGYRPRLTAINHWDIAVATHTENHPDARHLCASLDALNPTELYKPGQLDLLWASPECTHHSIARGGKPVNDQSRATAWCVTRWADALRPKVVMVENVKEFLRWGPIKGGKNVKEKIGATFHAWVETLRSFGYRVEWRILRAADYGDPTTRERLFVYAVRGHRKIVWPEPTHAAIEVTDMFGVTRKRWVPARDIIDWTDKGKSIFDRKKPLAPKTLNRILIGLEKFSGLPFIVPQHQGDGSLVDSIERPVRTINTKNGTGVAEPFLLAIDHKGGNGSTVRSIDKPLSVVTTKSRHAVAQPFLVHLRGTSTTRDLDKPAPAITAGGGHLGLVEPFLVQTAHGNGKAKNGDKRRVRSVDEPLPTVAGNRGDVALLQPFILPHPRKRGDGPRSVDQPLNTITATSCDMSLANPYLVKYNGTGGALSIDQPFDTVTAKPRFGLCRPILTINGEQYQLDILFRMLRPHELAQAQGFPKDYRFTGNISQVVKQIGNAVPVHLSKALVKSALSQKQ